LEFQKRTLESESLPTHIANAYLRNSAAPHLEVKSVSRFSANFDLPELYYALSHSACEPFPPHELAHTLPAKFRFSELTATPRNFKFPLSDAAIAPKRSRKGEFLEPWLE
jgi:hypothetical protein